LNAKVATVVFVASRQTNNPKSIKSILSVTETQSKDISGCYKKIKEIIPEAKVQTQASQIANSACNRLNLPMDAQQAVVATAKNITELQII
jgi:transcription initiation factor TFIIIB Brf1 subunit/transcription initiation factor TFIIB